MTNDVIKEAVARQQSSDKKVSAENRILGKVMTFHIGEQIYGIEFDESVYGLATTNMLIHGDGNSNIRYGSCFNLEVRL